MPCYMKAGLHPLTSMALPPLLPPFPCLHSPCVHLCVLSQEQQRLCDVAACCPLSIQAGQVEGVVVGGSGALTLSLMELGLSGRGWGGVGGGEEQQEPD